MGPTGPTSNVIAPTGATGGSQFTITKSQGNIKNLFPSGVKASSVILGDGFSSPNFIKTPGSTFVLSDYGNYDSSYVVPVNCTLQAMYVMEYVADTTAVGPSTRFQVYLKDPNGEAYNEIPSAKVIVTALQVGSNTSSATMSIAFSKGDIIVFSHSREDLAPSTSLNCSGTVSALFRL
jgi:hypothetical protein